MPIGRARCFALGASVASNSAGNTMAVRGTHDAKEDGMNANNGSKYQAGRKGTEIAALIRSEIRAACKADGVLKGYKVSVRFRWATHSKAIDISIEDAAANIMNPVWVKANTENPHVYQERTCRYTDAAMAAKKECERIMAQYNRDDSDVMTDYFDVEFYGSVQFAFDLEQTHTAKIACADHPACCGCSGCDARYAA